MEPPEWPTEPPTALVRGTVTPPPRASPGPPAPGPPGGADPSWWAPPPPSAPAPNPWGVAAIAFLIGPTVALTVRGAIGDLVEALG